jgi:DinB superfamily
VTPLPFTRTALTLSDEENFPAVKVTSAVAWQQAVEQMKQAHRELMQTVSGMTDSRLAEPVPGKDYDAYFMLQGVTQHELYHAGQIALLKKAQGK